MLQGVSSLFGQSETQKRIEVSRKRAAAREEGERSDGSDKAGSVPPPPAEDRGTRPSVNPPAASKSPPPMPPMPPNLGCTVNGETQGA